MCNNLWLCSLLVGHLYRCILLYIRWYCIDLWVGILGGTCTQQQQSHNYLLRVVYVIRTILIYALCVL